MSDQATKFSGFVQSENSTNCEITMPANWPEVAKSIDNLAELKVVQLVLWVTWGNGQPDRLESLTIDDFMEVTGLSQQSVRTGITKAIEHGYIVRKIEYRIEDGRVCQSRFYGINLCQEAQDLEVAQEFSDSEEVACEADPYESQSFSNSSNEFELYPQDNNTKEIIRIREDQDLALEEKPCRRLQSLSKDDNATLCNRMESLSKALGDHEHIASNIGQVRRILTDYQTREGNFEAFLLLMYEARDLARLKTNIRSSNRMPYFFACLKNKVKNNPSERFVGV